MRVRYYGPVGLPTGYGDAANEFCMAMLTAGIELEVLTPASQLHKDYAALGPHIRSDDRPPTPDPDVVIVHNLPLSCAKTLAAAQVRETCPDALLVAYTTWEGLRAPPELLESLSMFSQVWLPSITTSRAFDIGWFDSTETRVIPHASDAELAPPKERLCKYRFYSVGAWTVRKNMEGVIRAYLRAFRKSDDVELRLHCRPFGRAESAALVAVAATGMRPGDLPPINFTTDELTREQVALIHASSDCYVSASRGESWSLPAYDAMIAGNHVIATAGLGHEEFLRDTSWAAVDSRIVPASGEVTMQNDDGRMHGQFFGGDCLTIKQDWRDPDIAAMAHMMGSAYRYRPVAQVFRDPRERFGRAVVGQLIKRTLEEALDR